MNKKFVYKVGNNKNSYTMIHGQPNINNTKCLLSQHKILLCFI